MRYIQKGFSPGFFEAWKHNFIITEGRDPIYRDLRGDDYHNFKNYLIDEQYGLCCYCCKEIQDYNSHIEHFRPQHQDINNQLVLDYNNLLISCNGYKDNNENCGHKKNDWYSEYYTISPLEENCESMFTYTIDGHIKANHNDTRAQETIDNLELDLDLLQRARKSAIYVSGLFDDDFDEDRRTELIELFSTPQDGRLEGFCVAILYCLSNGC